MKNKPFPQRYLLDNVGFILNDLGLAWAWDNLSLGKRVIDIQIISVFHSMSLLYFSS